MVTHDLRLEDAFLDPEKARAADADLVMISGWGCGEDIRPGDFLLLAANHARFEVIRLTSRFARGLFFWTAACRERRA